MLVEVSFGPIGFELPLELAVAQGSIDVDERVEVMWFQIL
jgi:hypothetical protein